jgi:glycosyltransferase involved in cell wall biosynthesis
MKVAVLNTLYPPDSYGGAEKATEMLVEALAARSCEVFVICAHEGKEEIVDEWKGIKVYRLPIDNFYWPYTYRPKPGAVKRALYHLRDMWNFRAVARVKRVLEKERPDVLHTQNVEGLSVGVWDAAKKLGIRTVHTIHDYYLICPRRALFRDMKVCETRCLQCRAFTMTSIWSTRSVDYAVAGTDYVLNRHVEEGAFKKSRKQLLYNIQPNLSSLEEKLEHEEASDRPIRFGFIARMQEEKGIEFLLRAMKKLKNPSWELQIVGTGIASYVEDLQTRYADPRIVWLGFMPGLEFYPLVDVIVVPSLWPEPLPYVCVEALVSGKNILASRIGGMPELVSHATLYDCFTPSDEEDLLRALNRVLEDPEPWRKTHVPSTATKNLFSQKLITDGYQAIYEDANR